MSCKHAALVALVPVIWAAAGTGDGGPCSAAAAEQASRWKAKPVNILLIMIDDLGWMDLRCQGNQRLSTPNIDHLASQGMRFTDAYAAAPVCSPTRAAVLTGLSPAELHITNHIPDQERFIPEDAVLLPAEMLDHLPAERVTIAERLRSAGYTTGFFGKWHLAGRYVQGKQGLGDKRYYPEAQGFDVNRGGCALPGPFTYFDPYRIHNLPPREEGEYLPDRLADETIRFMQENRNKPFLAMLWPYTVHWPMEAPPALIEKYRKRTDLGLIDPGYAAMIAAMDAAVGHVLEALDELHISDRTLVIFTSDNGAYDGVADNRPLRGAKGFLYEGGLRVPLIVRWSGVALPGVQCHVPVTSMDLFPTLLDAAGLAPDPQTSLEGESLMPLLRQDGSLERAAVYFHYPNYAFHRQNRLGGAVREDEFKLIENFDDGSLELYNLKDDLGEKRNLADELPERAAAMKRQLAAWRKRVGAAMPRPASATRPRSGGTPPVIDEDP